MHPITTETATQAADASGGERREQAVGGVQPVTLPLAGEDPAHTGVIDARHPRQAPLRETRSPETISHPLRERGERRHFRASA
jgi:hypothetical protein